MAALSKPVFGFSCAGSKHRHKAATSVKRIYLHCSVARAVNPLPLLLDTNKDVSGQSTYPELSPEGRSMKATPLSVSLLALLAFRTAAPTPLGHTAAEKAKY